MTLYMACAPNWRAYRHQQQCCCHGCCCCCCCCYHWYNDYCR